MIGGYIPGAREALSPPRRATALQLRSRGAVRRLAAAEVGAIAPPEGGAADSERPGDVFAPDADLRRGRDQLPDFRILTRAQRVHLPKNLLPHTCLPHIN